MGLRSDMIPDVPIPSAQIPWRTVSIRAVRRRMLDPQASGNHDYIRSPQEQKCQCASMDTDPAIRINGEPTRSDISRVQHWVSGQQQQYHDRNPAPARPSEFLVQFTSMYPIGKSTNRGSGSHTFGGRGDGASSTVEDAGSIQGDNYVSFPPRGVNRHDENCPCYADVPVPVYQEVDPNPVSGRR